MEELDSASSPNDQAEQELLADEESASFMSLSGKVTHALLRPSSRC